ncbi:MAG: hypothetical protein AB7I79_05520 [Rhizobiaceae bacterium]
MTTDRKDAAESRASGAPALSTRDWDEVAGREVAPKAGFENGDFRYHDETEAPEEDDDNPAQESDDALPDENEEAAIEKRYRNLGEGGRET